jgi:8-oxo-dGTP pyrophosphatase MutT (NUDIX family)
MPAFEDARQRALASELACLVTDKPNSEIRMPFDPTHLSRMCSLAKSEGSALCREHFDPGHFTASAFVLSPSAEHLLLVDHIKLGMWLQPGGHIEVSDPDPVAAALRELHEETGLGEYVVKSRLFDIDVHQIPAWGSTPAHFHHDLRVLVQAVSEEVVGASDVNEARWFSLREIVQSRDVLSGGRGTDESVRRAASFLRSGRGKIR